MSIIQIDRSISEPLYLQVVRHFRELIDNETLLSGEKLPSSRRLAVQLGVNRTTICKAYEELWALGYIESKTGSYSYVRKRKALVKKKAVNSKGTINWLDIVSEKAENLKDINLAVVSEKYPGVIDFRPLSLDSELIPLEEFRKSMNLALNTLKSNALEYCDAFGHIPLREFIANHLQKHGMKVSSENILITNGAQNALDIISRLLVKPGFKVVVESPGYCWMKKLLHLNEADWISVDVLDNGLDLSELKLIFEHEKIAFVYTTPTFQNPTGITTSQSHREELLKICEEYEVPLVEDGFEEEMKYFSKAILPIKSMDESQVVLYVGTFSKVLFPGARIGWIAADKDCITLLSYIKSAGDLSTNMPNQVAINQFCQTGVFYSQLRKIHKEYRKRMQVILKEITRQNTMAGKVKFTVPSGGYTLWCTIEAESCNEDLIVKQLLDAGVAVSPGKQYFFSEPTKCYFRISIAQSNIKEIKVGINRIISVLENFV